MNAHTQLAVIGAGPGGYAAAFRAADLGLAVTLIDPRPAPGGVCLWEGCIPSKALLHAVGTIHRAAAAAAYGISFAAPGIDRAKLAAWKQHDVVERLTGGLKQLAEKRGVTYVQGTATFSADGDLEVTTTAGGTLRLSFTQAIIATGSRATVPPLLAIDSPRLWTAREALALESIPQRLLVVGGGYIGLEMATVYAALGSSVTVVEITKGLLPGVDRDLVRLVTKTIESCATLHLGTDVEELVDSGTSITATLAKDGKVWKADFDVALIATGRVPNSDGLGLEHTQVQTDAHGFVRVGPDRRSHDPRILAIGDITGQPMLAHKATHEGLVAAAVAAGHPDAFDPVAIPAVVFTHPELAWVGLTETEAAARHIPIRVGRFPWAASGRALAVGTSAGITKVLVDPESERVLGVGIVGDGASELIAEAALALELGATAEDIARTVHPHPSLSETVMEAAAAVLGASVHVFAPKRR